MTDTTTETSTNRIELYVQSLSPYGAREQQDRVIDTLADLESAGAIEEFELNVWGKYLCPDAAAGRTDLGRTYVERLERFREWRGADGRAMPFIEGHEVGDPYGETYTAVAVPVLLLAEFDGDELIHVAPCRHDDEVTTVHERVRTLVDAADHAVSVDTPDIEVDSNSTQTPEVSR